MYTTRNFKTKKQLKEAVLAWNMYQERQREQPASPVTYYQPNDMGFSPPPKDGHIFIEGPHYPEPHKWYAQCLAKGGVIVKVMK